MARPVASGSFDFTSQKFQTCTLLGHSGKSEKVIPRKGITLFSENFRWDELFHLFSYWNNQFVDTSGKRPHESSVLPKDITK